MGEKDLRVLTDFGRDTTTQESTYEVQFRYMNLFDREEGQIAKQAIAQRLAQMDYATMLVSKVGLLSPAIPTWIPIQNQMAPRPFPELDLIAGPFDGTDDEGRSLVDENVISTFYSRKNLPMKKKATPPTKEPPLAEKPAVNSK